MFFGKLNPVFWKTQFPLLIKSLLFIQFLPIVQRVTSSHITALFQDKKEGAALGKGCAFHVWQWEW